MLPLDAQIEAKVELRLAVEQQLRHYGPDDSDAEVRDIISLLVDRIRRRLADVEETQRKGRDKDAALRLANSLLRLMIDEYPVRFVGEGDSLKRRQVLGELCPKLQSVLKAKFTGGETTAQISGEVAEWLAVWLAEQQRAEDRRLGNRLVNFTEGAVKVATVVASIPVVAELTQIGLAALRQRVGRWYPPTPPGPPPA